jgi:RES domain-containing protein
MRIWRLVKSKYAASAFDGEGARVHGGRWNSVGMPAVYGADSAALAVLEVLVHLGDVRPLSAYSMVSTNVPDALIEDVNKTTMPKDWDAFPAAPQVQAFGDAWLRSGRALALRLPSVVVREGSNLLINPAHIKFARLTVEEPRAFRFGSRLVG